MILNIKKSSECSWDLKERLAVQEENEEERGGLGWGWGGGKRDGGRDGP